MRWFTEEAYEAEDDTWDQMFHDYEAHIARIMPRLPRDLARLAADPALNLHDASVREVRVDAERRHIVLEISAGDLLVGYRNLTVEFEDAEFDPDNLQAVAFAVGAEYKLSTGVIH